MTHTLRLSARFPFFLALAISLGLVAGGVVLAVTLNIAACPLCIAQRMLYLGVAAAALLGLALDRWRIPYLTATLVMAALSATGACVAAWQTYLQRFAVDTRCSGAMAWWEQLIDWAGEKLPLLFYASGLCSEPGWKFMGLSIAEWSLLAFSFLTALALYALLRRPVRHRSR